MTSRVESAEAFVSQLRPVTGRGESAETADEKEPRNHSPRFSPANRFPATGYSKLTIYPSPGKLPMQKFHPRLL